MLCGVWKGVFCTLCWYRSVFASCLECRRECFSCGIVKFVRERFSCSAAEITSVDVVN